MNLVIRNADIDDIDTVADIERLSFSEPWSHGMFQSHIRGDINTFLVASYEGAIVGFALAHTVVDESELLNIAIAPSMRCRSIATILLNAICERCAMRGAASITLDVRSSNAAARALYAKHGFVPVGQRRSYYRMPEEDALILRATLPLSAYHSVDPR